MPNVERDLKFLLMTTAELEKATGIPKNRWSLYFSGRSDMSMRTLNKAASALGLTSGELLEAITIRRKIRKENKNLYSHAS